MAGKQQTPVSTGIPEYDSDLWYREYVKSSTDRFEEILQDPTRQSYRPAFRQMKICLAKILHSKTRDQMTRALVLRISEIEQSDEEDRVKDEMAKDCLTDVFCEITDFLDKLLGLVEPIMVGRIAIDPPDEIPEDNEFCAD